MYACMCPGKFNLSVKNQLKINLPTASSYFVWKQFWSISCQVNLSVEFNVNWMICFSGGNLDRALLQIFCPNCQTPRCADVQIHWIGERIAAGIQFDFQLLWQSTNQRICKYINTAKIFIFGIWQQMAKAEWSRYLQTAPVLNKLPSSGSTVTSGSSHVTSNVIEFAGKFFRKSTPVARKHNCFTL